MTVGAPIGVAIGRPIGRLIGAGADGSWSANFLAGEFPSNITFTRASSAQDFNDPALTYATNVPVLTPSGLLLQGSRTNGIRNPRAEGATVGVIGSGGALPTNWSVVTSAGLTTEVVSILSSGFYTGVRIKISGTPSSTTTYQIGFEASNTIAALNGETWSYSGFITQNTGSFTNINQAGFAVSEHNSGGTYLTGGSVITDFKSSISTSRQRFQAQRLNTNASTAFVRPLWGISVTSGSAIDITLDIEFPQAENGPFASSLILPAVSSPAATTRAADLATISNLSSIGFDATQGTLVAEWQYVGISTTGNNQHIINLNAGSTLNTTAIYQNLSSVLHGSVVNGISSNNIVSGTTGTTYRAALGYISGNNQFYIHGTQAGGVSFIAATPNTGINNLIIGNRFDNNRQAFIYLRRLTYFPTRLPDAQLQALTA